LQAKARHQPAVSRARFEEIIATQWLGTDPLIKPAFYIRAYCFHNVESQRVTVPVGDVEKSDAGIKAL
jgi:hypothetical protein